MAVFDVLQVGTALLASETSFVNVTITSVDTTKTLFSWGARVETNEPGRGGISGVLLSPTVLQFLRQSATSTPQATISWYVATFSTNVVTQHFTSTPLSAQTTSVLIASVNTSQSAIFHSWWVSGGNTNDDDFYSARFQSATTAQFITVAVPNTLSGINFQIFENSDCTIQQGRMKFGGATTTSSDTVTSVNTSKSIVISTYHSAAGTVTNLGQKMVIGQFSSPTVVRFMRQDSGQAVTLEWKVVEFTDGTVVQAGTAVFATVTTLVNVTITSVATNRSISLISGMAGRGGMGLGSGDDNTGPYNFTHRLTSPTNLELYRQTTGNTSATVSWEVVQFDTAAVAAAVEIFDESYVLVA